MAKPCYKIVTMGDADSGKTSLIYRHRFKNFSETQSATIGAAFSVDVIDGVKLQIWDTAGNERYRSLTPMYLRGADLVLYCIDSSKEFNVESTKKTLEFIRAENDYSTVFITATKSDIAIDNEVRKIKEFVKDIGSEFVLTSSKTGEGIDHLFSEISKVLRDIKDNNPSRFIRGVDIKPSENGCFVFFKNWF